MPSMTVNCVAMFWAPRETGEAGLEMGWVRGLLMSDIQMPPMIARAVYEVCGISCPMTTVEPMKGAPNSQKRAQQIVENDVIFRFSGLTSSTVLVVSMESDVDIAILETIAVHINIATFASSDTTPGLGTSQQHQAKKPANILNMPAQSHFRVVFKIRYSPKKVPSISQKPAMKVFI